MSKTLQKWLEPEELDVATVDADKLLSVGEAAEILGVTAATLRNWDRVGKLPARRDEANGYRSYSLSQIRELAMTSDSRSGFVTKAPVRDIGIRTRIHKMHSVLRDHDGSSSIIGRFDEITRLLLAAAYAAKNNEGINSIADVSRVLACFHEERPDLMPLEFTEFQSQSRTLSRLLPEVEVLAHADWDQDLAGQIYEATIGGTFDAGDHQQFFTPDQVVTFMVDACSGWMEGVICDPASGTGGFLAKSVRSKLNYSELIGFEIDPRLAWVTGANVWLHGESEIRSQVLSNGGSLGPEAERWFGQIDGILTNPPFGSDTSDPAILSSFSLGRGRSSRRRGILFLERCSELLRVGGRLAIVIDEGVLNQDHSRDVRALIRDRFAVEGVVSLPDSAFLPYANVKTSILMLTKSKKAAGSTFFGNAQVVGRRNNGERDIVYDATGGWHENSDLPTIGNAWQDHQSGRKRSSLTDELTAFVSPRLDPDRLDVVIHDPARLQAEQRIRQHAGELVELRDLCEERRETLVPAKELPDAEISYSGLAQLESLTGEIRRSLVPTNSLKSAVRWYEPGDVLFSRMRPGLRKVAVADFESGGYVSSECVVFTPRILPDGSQAIAPELLAALLRSDFVFGQIVHNIVGIGRPRIGVRSLRSVLLPKPTPATQHSAIKQLAKDWSQRAKLRRQIEQLQEQLSTANRDSNERAVELLLSERK